MLSRKHALPFSLTLPALSTFAGRKRDHKNNRNTNRDYEINPRNRLCNLLLLCANDRARDLRISAKNGIGTNGKNDDDGVFAKNVVLNDALDQNVRVLPSSSSSSSSHFSSRSTLTYEPSEGEVLGIEGKLSKVLFKKKKTNDDEEKIEEEEKDEEGEERRREMLRFCEPVVLRGDDYGDHRSSSSVKKKKKLRVAVLLSGGVDSSVALALLRAAGHECVAFYLQIWFQDDFRNFWDQCPWEEDVQIAREVCVRLGVPLRTVHFTDDYWNLVVKQSVEEIKSGKTPNPDILCNSRVKFGAFRDWLDTNEKEVGKFDRIASGHYAALERIAIGEIANVGAATTIATEDADRKEKVKLVASGDAKKDQTYFLAHLNARQLQKAMFPIGGLPKPRIREIADDLKLANAGRKDSQGICFLGKVKFSEFIEEHLGTNAGEIREIETGEILGTHKGFWFHTVGQRQGLKLDKRAHEGPWYVHSKDVQKNVVYITRDYHSEENERERDSFECSDLSWCSSEDLDRTSTDSRTSKEEKEDALATEKVAKIDRCKVRHGESYYECVNLHYYRTNDRTNNEARIKIKINGTDQGLAKGQYAVFYSGAECLGCGVIC